MPTKHGAIAAIMTLVLTATTGRADDIRPAMEAANGQWVAAFEAPAPGPLVSQYTPDAVLYFQGHAPAAGANAIQQFWDEHKKSGARDYTFDIVRTGMTGASAWQIARTTFEVTPDTGACAVIVGRTLRIFERQSDGTWRTKIHIWDRRNGVETNRPCARTY